MKFNENTQFPVFAKSVDDYMFFPSKNILFYFETRSKLITIESREKPCGLYSGEEEITKEEFIKANKELLEKTGLIKLFETKEVTHSTISNFEKAIKNRDKNLEELATRENVHKEKIKSLKEELSGLKFANRNNLKTIEKYKTEIDRLNKEYNFNIDSISNAHDYWKKNSEILKTKTRNLELQIKSLEEALKHYL